MDKPQHDLSFDEVKLDYKALLDTATLAVRYSREELNRHIHKMYDQSLAGEPSTGVDAERIEETASHLAQAIRTRHALWHGQTRTNVIIVNHDVTLVCFNCQEADNCEKYSRERDRCYYG